MKKIKHTMHFGSECVVTFDSDDQKDTLTVGRRIGGIVWPRVESPGYYCIFGESLHFATGHRPITLLAEYQNDMPGRLFAGLVADARNTICSDFYGDVLSSPDSGAVEFTRAFRDHMKRSGAGIRILQTPIPDWFMGVSAVRQWATDGALNIEKDSILGRQMGQMTADAIKDEGRRLFYAVNALKNAIGAFERSPVQQGAGGVSPAPYCWA